MYFLEFLFPVLFYMHEGIENMAFSFRLSYRQKKACSKDMEHQLSDV